MLTKKEVFEIERTGDTNRLAKAYEAATEDEQGQLMAWYAEAQSQNLDGIDIPGVTFPEETLLEDEIARIEEAARRAPRQSLDSATARNRARAMRGNMLKKLKRVYPPYTLFTPQQAADRTKSSVYDMAAYLANEAQLPGAQIHYDENHKKYFIMSIYG